MTFILCYLPRQAVPKKENEERHNEFQVPMGQPGGESHEETENTRLERTYSQGYRFRSAKDI